MTTVFRSRHLPAPLAGSLWAGLAEAHRRRPFSAAEPREQLARVSAIAARMGLQATVYRGSLALMGADVDHLWLGVEAVDIAPRAAPGGDSPARGGDGGAFVVDPSFPLFDDGFVQVLRRWVAGDADGEELNAAAATADIEARVMGVFPEGLRYLGAPVWSARR